MWKIVATTDGDHVGTDLPYVEKGQIITFDDGDVVEVVDVFLDNDGNKMMVTNPNYSITLERY